MANEVKMFVMCGFCVRGLVFGKFGNVKAQGYCLEIQENPKKNFECWQVWKHRFNLTFDKEANKPISHV